jgi:PAS domain-containing protein
MAHLFICPNCGNRSTASERTAGFRREARGCKKCGFGFLFELMDDYYPAPDAAFFVCDQQGKVIGCGRGSFELTGLDDQRVIGRDINEVLGLKFDDGADQVGTALEWGVRVLDKPVEVNAEGDLPARAKADLFPAYDDDGGLLVVLSPSHKSEPEGSSRPS